MVIKTEKFICSIQKEQADLKAVGAPSWVPRYEEIYSRVLLVDGRPWVKSKPIINSTSRMRSYSYIYSNLGVIAPKGLNEWK